MSSPTLIDDTNPVVQYAPGWIWDQLVNEVDHTRHGAAIAGLTASLGFYGSGVQVVGTLEPTDRYGQPTTTYKIDGGLAGTYNAPFTASGDTHFNVTFFSNLDLTLDNHEIVITNVNGTSPNTFWLDYFLIYTEPGGTTTTSTSTSVTPSNSPTNTLIPTVHTTSTTSATTSSSTAAVPTALAPPLSTASSSSSSSSLSTSTDPTTHPFSGTATASSQSNASTKTSGTSSATSVSPASGASHSSAHSNIGKIVGGVVGGVAFLALLGLAFFCARRRRRAPNNVEPFTTQTRERASSSGTLLSSGGSPAVKVNKIPELSLASSAAVTSPASHPHLATASSTISGQLAEASAAPTVATGGASVAAVPSGPSPISPRRDLSPADMKLQESIYGPSSARSTPRIGRSPLSPAPSSVGAGAGASDYAPSSALTPAPAPADTEASRARWYAPAREQEQSRAQSLLSLLSSRGRRRRDRDRDQDSGLRLYNEPALPPPYTAD